MTTCKRILAAAMAAVPVMALAACGTSITVPSQDETATERQMSLLVQGNLDELYLGTATPEYLELVEDTEKSAEELHETCIAYEADYFADYFEIEYMTEELTAQITELYREIYSHARYTVGAASRLDENTYVVKADVEPIDIMELAIDASGTALEAFSEQYAGVDVDAMTEEEYAAYDADWAQAVIAMVKEQLPRLGHKEKVSLTVRVVQGDDGIWRTDNDDLNHLDEKIIYYP